MQETRVCRIVLTHFLRQDGAVVAQANAQLMAVPACSCVCWEGILRGGEGRGCTRCGDQWMALGIKHCHVWHRCEALSLSCMAPFGAIRCCGWALSCAVGGHGRVLMLWFMWIKMDMGLQNSPMSTRPQYPMPCDAYAVCLRYELRGEVDKEGN